MVNTSLFGLIFFSLFNLQLFGRVPFLSAEVFIEYYEIVLLWFTLTYYFLFQMIFLKKYFILSVLTAFSTFLIIAYYIKGISLDNFIFKTASKNEYPKAIAIYHKYCGAGVPWLIKLWNKEYEHLCYIIKNDKEDVIGFSFLMLSKYCKRP